MHLHFQFNIRQNSEGAPMRNKTCFMFGHATAPEETVSLIEAAAEKHYHKYGIHTFIVGNHGSFDSYARIAITRLKERYSDISLFLLLAYHPSVKRISLPIGFDQSYYPPIENVPKQYAIVRANQYLVKESDSIICFVIHPGNSRNLLEYARRCQSKKELIIDNIHVK